MTICDQFQARILDYLYGLLEAHESAAIEPHVQQCAACQNALNGARQQKELLALAAKTGFPHVRFVMPEATRLPLPQQRPAWRLARWAVAAGILVAVTGVSVLGAMRWQNQVKVTQLAARSQEIQSSLATLNSQFQGKMKQADLHILDLENAYQKILVERVKRVHEMQMANAKKPLHLNVTGPQTVQSGARNDYLVQINNSMNQPVAAELSAKVIDQHQRDVVAAVPITGQGNGLYQLSLPKDLPFKPDAELFLVLDAAEKNSSANAKKAMLTLTEKLTLSNPLYITHLTTDKPLYQPGEVVRFHSLTVERFSLKPGPEDLRLVYTLGKPQGDQEQILTGVARIGGDPTPLGSDQKPIRGVGAGEYLLGPDAPGGEYTLTVSEASQRFPPQVRKFLVNRYEKPRLNKELEFTRKSYGPGDEVDAACKVARAEGGKPVALQPVTVAVTIDGKSYNADGKESAGWQLQTDPAGGVSVRFRLPAVIDRGRASLAVTFQDDGNVETLVRAIPLVLKKLLVDFYPEGGDLIGGVANTIYFQARTTLDKPAELTGRIVDAGGQTMAAVKTFNDAANPGANQGMGAVAFIPKAGDRYQLIVDAPVGIAGTYFLPEVKADGIVMSIQPPDTSDKERIHVLLTSAAEDRHLLVGAYCRGRLMAQQRILAVKNKPAVVNLTPDAGVGGVYRVTVYEEQNDANHRRQLIPRAERLIYRAPAARLNVVIKPDKQKYAPGDRVTVHFSAKDEKGQATPAILLASVVDKSVLKMADEKTFRSMPTHFLLTNEVRRPEDLEHADFLLENHPNAVIALDLLLGTQGWRRFAEQEPNRFQQKNALEGERLLVANGNLAPTTRSAKITDLNSAAIEQVTEEYQVKLVSARDQLANAQKQRQVISNEQTELNQKTRELHKELAALDQEYAATLAKFQPIGDGFEAARGYIVAVLGLGLLVALVLAARAGKGAAPYLALASSVGMILLAAALFPAVSPDVRNGALIAQAPVPQRMAEGRAPAGMVKGEAAAPLAAPELMDEKQGRLGEANRFAAPDAPMPALKELAKDNLIINQPRGFRQNVNAANAPGLAAGKAGNIGPGRNQIRGLNRDPGEQRNMAKAPAQALDGARLPRLMQADKAGQAGMARNLQANGALPMRNGALPMNAGRAMKPEFRKQLLEVPAFERMNIEEPPLPPFVIREYAHQRVHGEIEQRSDFTETLYWNPVLVLANGEGEASFQLCDSVTSFQVMASAHTLDGRLAAATGVVESRLPLTLEPKIPIEITAGDKMEVPLAIANNTDAGRTLSLQAKGTNLEILGGGMETVSLRPDERTRRLYSTRPTIAEGEAELDFLGASPGAPGDRIHRTLKIVPEGFPILHSQSDILEKVVRQEVVLPPTWIAGTLKYQFAAYPSTLADLQQGLEALLREPGGCFEQTSTSNYPNLLILDYLKESNQAKPEVAKRAQGLLTRGYQQLIAFECQNPAKNKREGYEWFGGSAPPHEALTAYGLMQFRDMARVFDVDKAMLARTQAYLMARRDGKGGFERNPRALDTFGQAPANITNAYIVWSLTESGQDDVTQELNALVEQAKTSKDPYFLGLVANSLLNRGRTESAIGILKQLAGLQDKDGHLDAAQTSITGSGGRDLQIETTAITLLGWLKAKRPDLFTSHVLAAVRWIGQQRGGYGGFGSTQSTILALKALIAYAKENKKTAEEGDLILYVGNREVQRLHFPAGAQEAITLELNDPESHLKAGTNIVRVELTGKSVFPYTAAWSYQSVKPASAASCPIRLTTTLARQTAEEGSTVQLTAVVENKSTKGQAMTVAIIGLPAGLTLPEDLKQLKDLARLRNNGTEPGPISAWEIRGRELVLYWRDMAPEKRVEVTLDLMCRVPGDYHGPAGRAYLYYNADHKCWVEPLHMIIRPKNLE